MRRSGCTWRRSRSTGGTTASATASIGSIPPIARTKVAGRRASGRWGQRFGSLSARSPCPAPRATRGARSHGSTVAAPSSSASERAPDYLLGRERAGVGDALRHPPTEIVVRLDRRGVDAEPAVHRSPAHDETPYLGFADELVRPGRIDPEQQPTLAAGTDGQVAADQEGEATEHRLLGEPALRRQHLAQPVRELVVIRHEASMAPDADTGQDVAKACCRPARTGSQVSSASSTASADSISSISRRIVQPVP